MASTQKVTQIEVAERHLRLHFNDSTTSHADYHYFWLRHNCSCLDGCKHQKTKERLIDSSDFSIDIKPKVTEITSEGGLRIVWENDHETTLPADWLIKYAYSKNQPKIIPPSNNVDDILIDYEELLKNDPTNGYKEYQKRIADRIINHGFVVVKNRGLDTEALIRDLLPPEKEVIISHFGRIEDLMTNNTTNQNNDQLGYTNAAVDLHTDLPFVENPPGMQALQCIRPADVGGGNYLVDAFASAQYLKQTDRHAYDILSTVPITFHRKQQNYEAILVTPLITVKDGEIVQVRYSYFTLALFNVPFDQMEDWYNAYNKFAKIVRNKNHQYHVELSSGDYVLYDNYRMFHARTGFSGARHMRGIYFHKKDVLEHLKGSQ